jgi:hypothetical protein
LPCRSSRLSAPLWSGTRSASMFVCFSVFRYAAHSPHILHIAHTINNLNSILTRVLSCAQYEGISRMSTSLRRRHRDRVVRCAECGVEHDVVYSCKIMLLTAFVSCLQAWHWPDHRERRTPLFEPSMYNAIDFLCLTLIVVCILQFYATEAGRAHFADQLTSIRYCVQETW